MPQAQGFQDLEQIQSAESHLRREEKGRTLRADQMMERSNKKSRVIEISDKDTAYLKVHSYLANKCVCVSACVCVCVCLCVCACVQECVAKSKQERERCGGKDR